MGWEWAGGRNYIEFKQNGGPTYNNFEWARDGLEGPSIINLNEMEGLIIINLNGLGMGWRA